MEPNNTNITEERYSVVQFFMDDNYEVVHENLGAEEAVKKVAALTSSVGAKIGTTKRVIITDSGDFTCFEWKFGEGVVFPPLNANLAPA